MFALHSDIPESYLVYAETVKVSSWPTLFCFDVGGKQFILGTKQIICR
jgi:hypothetical protein